MLPWWAYEAFQNIYQPQTWLLVYALLEKHLITQNDSTFFEQHEKGYNMEI